MSENLTAEERRAEAGPSRDIGHELKERYQELRDRIAKGKEKTIWNDEFEEIVRDFETSHASLHKLREQGEDAEIFRDYLHSLLDKLNAIVSGDNLNPNQLVSALQRNFECDANEESEPHNQNGMNRNRIDWEKIGSEAIEIFFIPPGFNTMIGPMEMEEKQKRQPAQRKARTNPKEALVNPAAVNVAKEDESKKATDANVEAMFRILRRNKSVKFVRLVLNRRSFAQTAENIFALSFLAKDGRVSLSNGVGDIVVELTNPPTEEMRAKGEAVRRQLCLKFEYNDWEKFKELLPEGEELMPCRPLDDDEEDSSENSSYEQYSSPEEDVQLEEAPRRSHPHSQNGNVEIQRDNGGNSDGDEEEEEETVHFINKRNSQRKGKRRLEYSQ